MAGNAVAAGFPALLAPNAMGYRPLNMVNILSMVDPQPLQLPRDLRLCVLLITDLKMLSFFQFKL
jgi:hypothetical protein